MAKGLSLTLAIFLAGFLGAACAPRVVGTGSPQGGSIPASEWRLEVRNEHWLDVTVHVLRDGQRTRVGSVAAGAALGFILSQDLLGSSRTIQVEAQAVGAPTRVATDELVVQGGQRVALTLATGLRCVDVGVR